ncbi:MULTISPECIES: TonB-dependent receptor [Solimonas]|uniref:TonB-dependent receptor n=1 Tax=Solimonas TaxID=413435 RepID=UPI000365EF67|nr:MULTISPECIES: TonB-dependent receptor [Solimonas]
MNKTSTRTRSERFFALSAIAATVASSFSMIAHAQSTATPPPAQTDEIETIVVTGSNIRRTDKETASPVEVLSRDAIEATGKQNIGEILQTLTANNQGSIPGSFTSGFAGGSAAVSLRGLGVNSTLVLIDGRRVAPYGLADDGQRSFVDLNTIPLEAVERVEVLKDGASAIYGSDAIAGVVNIILRKDYEGASIGGNLGTSYKDDGDVKRLYGSYGIGNAATDGYNAFITAEASRQDRIANTDRDGYLATNNLLDYGWYDNRRGGSPYGWAGATGSLVNPYGAARLVGATSTQRRNVTACPETSPASGDGEGLEPVCLWDPIAYSSIQPKVDRANILSGGTLRITDSIRATASLGYFYSQTEGMTTPSSVTRGGTYNANSGSYFNPSVSMRLPAGHPDNPFGNEGPVLLSYSTNDFGGRREEVTNDAYRAVLGLDGAFFDTSWTWNTGFTYSRVETKRELNGYILGSVMQDALNRPLNPFRINNPSLNSQSDYDAISPTLNVTAKNTLMAFDGSVNGSLFSLPGGDVMMAVGGEWRKEKYDAPAVPGTETGDVNGLGYSAFADDRKIYAAYTEIVVPVVKMLELDAAVRYDHYDEYGSSTNPKFGFKFKPIDQVALRGTYAEGFRAPGPAEGGDAATFGYTGIALITAGNPDIKPETSKSYTLGLVVEPIKNMSATIDYYLIKRENEIVGADQGSVQAGVPLQGEPGTSVPGALPNSLVVYGPEESADPNTGLAKVTAVYAPYINANKTKTDGLEANIQQSLRLADIGKIKLNAGWTHVFNFERDFGGGDVREYAGTHGPYALSSASGTPSDRGTFSVSFERANWTVTAQVNYVSGMDLIDFKGQSLNQETDENGNPIPVWYNDSTGNEYSLPNGPSKLACDAYTPDGKQFSGDCRLPSFTTWDLFGKMDVTNHWTITGSIQNLFNKEAPFDPYTYGGTNYNPAFHQAGAVGRFFTAGLKYTF